MLLSPIRTAPTSAATPGSLPVLFHAASPSGVGCRWASGSKPKGANTIERSAFPASQPRNRFADASHGRALADAGFADDLVVCGALDSYPVVPIYADRQITRLGPDRVR